MVDDAKARRELGYAHSYDMDHTLGAIFDEW
jgi:hypothetical protein